MQKESVLVYSVRKMLTYSFKMLTYSFNSNYIEVITGVHAQYITRDDFGLRGFSDCKWKVKE